MAMLLHAASLALPLLLLGQAGSGQDFLRGRLSRFTGPSILQLPRPPALQGQPQGLTPGPLSSLTSTTRCLLHGPGPCG